jgi:hypothetical protein
MKTLAHTPEISTASQGNTVIGYTKDNIEIIKVLINKMFSEPTKYLDDVYKFFIHNSHKLHYGSLILLNVSNFDPIEIQLDTINIHEIELDITRQPEDESDAIGIDKYQCEMFIFQLKNEKDDTPIMKFELPFIFTKEYFESSENDDPPMTLQELRKLKETKGDCYIGRCYADQFKYKLMDDGGLIETYEITETKLRQMKTQIDET